MNILFYILQIDESQLKPVYEGEADDREVVMAGRKRARLPCRAQGCGYNGARSKRGAVPVSSSEMCGLGAGTSPLGVPLVEILQPYMSTVSAAGFPSCWGGVEAKQALQATRVCDCPRPANLLASRGPPL